MQIFANQLRFLPLDQMHFIALMSGPVAPSPALPTCPPTQYPVQMHWEDPIAEWMLYNLEVLPFILCLCRGIWELVFDWITTVAVLVGTFAYVQRRIMDLIWNDNFYHILDIIEYLKLVRFVGQRLSSKVPVNKSNAFKALKAFSCLVLINFAFIIGNLSAA